MWEEMVYEPHLLRSAERQVVSCGQLLDLVLGILQSRPSYLRAVEVARYTTLVKELRQSTFTEWFPQKRSIAVVDARVDSLGRAARQWVETYLRDHENPLMPSFAVDTARFVEAHAWGRRFYPENRRWWRIVGLLHNAGETEREQFGFLDDKQFKKTVTERGVGNTVAVLRLPEGVACRDSRKQPVVIGPAEVGVVIRRGHLSQSTVDVEELSVEDDEPLEFDFTDEFWFDSQLIVIDDGRRLQAWTPDAAEPPWSRPYHGRNLRVPGRWLVAAICPGQDHRGFVRRELPAWGE